MAVAVIIEKDKPVLTPGLKVIKAADYAVFSNAETAVAKARQNAARITGEADAAYQAQKARGYRDGLEKAQQAMAEATLANALAIETYKRGLARQTIDLVMAVVRKVLQDLDPGELVVAQVKKALQNMKMRRQVLVRTHPANAEILNRKLTEIMAAYPGIQLLQVKPDSTLAPDNLVLESESGIVDASMDIQLAAIEKAFRQHADPIENRNSNSKRK